jgi:hypothetical protein
LRKPHIAGRRKTPRVLAPASVNRTIELLRHMMNWAVGREYIDRTPFRRGTETLIRKLREDNQRRRRIPDDEEAQLLAVAPPLLRSMIIPAWILACAKARCWRSASLMWTWPAV